MKISIDTKEDSNDDIKKVIRMLQNIIGDAQEIFTNQPTAQSQSDENALAAENAFASMFGDASASSEAPQTPSEDVKEAQQGETPADSTEDLFAELFSEEEIKKMGIADTKNEDDEEQIKPKDKKYDIELY